MITARQLAELLLETPDLEVRVQELPNGTIRRVVAVEKLEYTEALGTKREILVVIPSQYIT
jgi:hypothetical protein